MVQNLLAIWNGLDAKRRGIVAGATVAVFVAVLLLSRMATTPGMALLYSGLEGAAAGEVIAALEQRAVPHEVRGSSIWVDDSQRDSLRMVLAAEGLPANSGTGYELLDGLSGFGTTSQMFDAAYWRAKEGELARTVLANPQIRAARVHIGQGSNQPFQTGAAPTASITVTTASGSLPEVQARALRHLVAAAVPGLVPEAVAVIDTVGGLIGGENEAQHADGAAAARAAEIRANVERLLAARVGAGKAVVEVAVDLVTEREQITERKFDPQGRVAISSETEERSGSSTDPGGAVTVASNLPAGDAAGEGGKSQNSETKERVNYEVSETQREILRSPGAIRRLSVAVLVDGQEVAAADGTLSQQPRAEEELAVLRELVASAVGLDEARGDVLTLKSLAFQPLPSSEVVEAGLLPQIGPIDVMSVIQIAVLGLVALVLGLFVLRPLLLNGARDRAALPAPTPILALPAMASEGEQPRVLTGVIDDGPGLIPGDTVQLDPVARLRRLIDERQAESVEILRGWMELEEERS